MGDAVFAAFYDWDWAGAKSHYEKTLERNRNHAATYLDYAVHPTHDPIRTLPRYQALRTRLGLN